MHTKLPFLSIQMDLSGVAAWNPLASPAPPPGPHAGVIMDVDPNYHEGKSTKFTVDLEGGQTTDLYIGNEPGDKGGNLKKWKTALIAVATASGVAEDLATKACSTKVNFDPVQTFKGKKIHVLVIEVPGTNADPQTGAQRPNLPNKEFITKAQFDAVKASGVTPVGRASTNGATAGAAQTPGVTPAVTPTPAAPPADPLASLFAKA
jgi:hypothetical protein